MNLDLELDMLDFAERIGDKELIGGAYYRVMCSVYSSEHRGWKLDARRMAKLEHGKAQLISKWQEIFEDWGLQQFQSEVSEAKDEFWLHRVWKALAKGRFPLHDVVGKIKAAMSTLRVRNGIGNPRRELMQTQLDEIKSVLYDTFSLPMPESQEPL